jgi:hypothetical protein
MKPARGHVNGRAQVLVQRLQLGCRIGGLAMAEAHQRALSDSTFVAGCGRLHGVTHTEPSRFLLGLVVALVGLIAPVKASLHPLQGVAVVAVE